MRKTYRGIALVAVLWGIALLTIVAGALSATLQREARLAGNLLAQAQARHAAEGAVHLAILALLAPGDEPPDGSVHDRAIGHAAVRVAIQDEAGKIDLNLARERLLHGLLLAVGAGDRERHRAVDAILDWRDADDAPRADGAEDREYLAAGIAYGAKDGHFDSIEELQLVMGMTPELYRKLRPALTVYARRPDVDPRLAPPLVRLALAAAEGIVGEDGAALPRSARENETDAGRRSVARPRNGVYRIHAQARAPNGVTAHVSAVVTVRHGDQRAAFTILEWRRDGEELFTQDARREGGASWS